MNRHSLTIRIILLAALAGGISRAQNEPAAGGNDNELHFFMRFTLLNADAPPVRGQLRSSWYHRPWNGTSGPDILGVDGAPVPPETPSAWGNVFTVFNQANKGNATIRLSFKGAAPLPARWRARVDFATRPDPAAIVKSHTSEWDGDTLAYVMPYDVARFPDDPPIESVQEITARHLAFAESLDLPGGKGDFRPKNFRLEGQARGWSHDQTAGQMRVLAALGFNAPQIQTYLDVRTDRGAGELREHYQAAIAAGINPSNGWYQQYMEVRCSYDPAEIERIQTLYRSRIEAIKTRVPNFYRDVHAVKIADEPRMLNDLRHIPGCEHCQAAFRLWLREQGVTPQQVGFETWEDVRASLPVHDGPVEARRLTWYTHLFAIETGPLPFKYATEAIQEAFGRPVQTSINPSMGAVAGARMASDGNGWSFPALGRTGATTIPWTEDWPLGNPHLTPFLVDLLRASAATRNIPLGMYIIWGWVPSAEPHFAELKTMSAVARGTKYLNYYFYGPRFAGGANTWSEDPVYCRGVAYVNRVLGLSDAVLGPAMPPDRKVAILWSVASDQWLNPLSFETHRISSLDATFAIERRMLHHAFTMQQIPVDYLDDVDLPTRLQDYQVLYMPASHLPRPCVPAIRDWVMAGGALVVGNGGPAFDETKEPLDFLSLLGLTQIERRRDAIAYASEPRVRNQPTDTVTLNGATIGVAGCKDVLTPGPDAKVLGTYAGGGAAVVEYSLGQGRVTTFGFNPGISLLMKMDPVELAKLPVFWNVFPEAELAMIAGPAIRAGALPPVSTQVGVDAARLDGPEGIAVTLANYTLSPIADLSLLVRGIRTAGAVTSAVRGSLTHRFTAEGLVVNLPLDVVDVVMIKP